MKDFMVFSYHSKLHYQQQYFFRVGFSRIVQVHIFYKNIEITEFQILGSQQLCNEKNVTTDIDTALNEFVLLNELSKMKIEKENLHPYKMFCKTTSNMQKHGRNRNTTCIPNQEIDYLLKVIHLGGPFSVSRQKLNLAAIEYSDFFFLFSTFHCGSIRKFFLQKCMAIFLSFRCQN